jgi:hypothetical protein
VHLVCSHPGADIADLWVKRAQGGCAGGGRPGGRRSSKVGMAAAAVGCAQLLAMPAGFKSHQATAPNLLSCRPLVAAIPPARARASSSVVFWAKLTKSAMAPIT